MATTDSGDAWETPPAAPKQYTRADFEAPYERRIDGMAYEFYPELEVLKFVYDQKGAGFHVEGFNDLATALNAEIRAKGMQVDVIVDTREADLSKVGSNMVKSGVQSVSDIYRNFVIVTNVGFVRVAVNCARFTFGLVGKPFNFCTGNDVEEAFKLLGKEYPTNKEA